MVGEVGQNCGACHKNAKGADKLKLGGDHALVTPVGVFNVPNISPDKTNGIGNWSVEDFANAMLHGTSPEGRHGECHTPRAMFGFGGMDTTKWLSGGPAPEGLGKIPNITPHETGIGSWSQEDIVYYLESGFTPDYDSVGGTMVDVQQNMAKLPKSDLEAIAAYLKAVPAVPSPN